MIRLNVTAPTLDAITADVRGTPRQARAALRSTLTKMSRWLVRGVTMQLRGDLGLPARVLTKRVVRAKVRSSSAGVSARIWVGTNPVGLHEWGGRRTRAGVRTRRGVHAGTFLGRSRGTAGKRVIFKRVGSDRLPIDKQTVAVADAANRAIDKVLNGADVERWFIREFERELMRRVSRSRGSR